MDEIDQIRTLRKSKERSNRVRNSQNSISRLKKSELMDNSQATTDDEDSKEVELDKLKQLFQKIMLLTQMDDLDSFREFFFSSQDILDMLYEDLDYKESLYDQKVQERELKKQELADLKKKKKTNKEYIDEDKQSYILAKSVVQNRHRNIDIEDKDIDNQDQIQKIEYFIDDVKKYTLINVDKFWEKRKIKMSTMEEEEAQTLEKEGHVEEEAVQNQEGEEEDAQDAENKDGADVENKPVLGENGEPVQPVDPVEDKKTDPVEEPVDPQAPQPENQEDKAQPVEESPENDVPAETEKVDAEQEIVDKILPDSNTPALENTLEGTGEDTKNLLSENAEEGKMFESQVLEQSQTESQKHQEELNTLKKEEFKNDILEFGVKGKDIKDPELKKLDDKIKSYKPQDEKVLDKVKWLEKLTEDVNLLTNFLRNKKIDASQIKSLHKPIRKQSLNQDEINRDITEKSYRCEFYS